MSARSRTAALEDAEAEAAYLRFVMCDAATLSAYPLASAMFAVRFHAKVHAAMVVLHERGDAIATDTLGVELGLPGDERLLDLTNALPHPGREERTRDRIEELHLARAQRLEALAAVAQIEAGEIGPGREALVAAANRADAVGAARWSWLAEWSADPIGEAPPPRRWLLRRRRDDDRSEGWLALGKAGMLASAGGVGKTTAAVQLALAVATGRPWLGSLDVVEPGAVALLLAEEDRDEVLRKVHWAARALGLDERERELAAKRLLPLPFAGRPTALLELDDHGNLVESSVLRAIRRELRVRGGPWRLVILDPLARLAPPEAERDNQIATRLVSAVESLCDAPGGPTVLVLHHTHKQARGGGRADAQAARGSSAFSDGFRWSAVLEQLDARDSVRLNVVKSNYSAAGEPLYLRRSDGGALRPMTVTERAEIDDEPAPRRRRSETF